MTAEGRKFGEDRVLYRREIEATEWMEIEREQTDAHVKATNPTPLGYFCADSALTSHFQ